MLEVVQIIQIYHAHRALTNIFYTENLTRNVALKMSFVYAYDELDAQVIVLYVST